MSYYSHSNVPTNKSLYAYCSKMKSIINDKRLSSQLSKYKIEQITKAYQNGIHSGTTTIVMPSEITALSM